MLVGSNNGGVDHHVFVVVIFRQRLKNTIENAAFAPASQPLVDVLPIAEAGGKIAPGNAGPVAIQHRLDEQTIVGRRATDMALPAGKPILDPIPLIVPQTITMHRPAPPKTKAAYESLNRSFGNPSNDDTP
jgi:hypothetical protein